MAISRQRYLFNAPEAGTHYVYIDLALGLSAQERRFHTQHKIYNVRGGLLKDSNQDAVAAFNVAPDTWVTKAAVKRGKKMYDKMNNDALRQAGAESIKSKYYDYKIYLNDSMRTGTMLYPKDAEGNNIPRGEWTYSSYHSQDVDWSDPALLTAANRQADSYYAHIVGDHVGISTNWTSVGLIDSWFHSRSIPQVEQPRTLAPTLDPLNNLFDSADSDDEILDSMRNDNDQTPYSQEDHFGYVDGSGNAPGRYLQRVAFGATQSGAGQISAINGFSAICGLVEIKIDVIGSGLVEILLDVETQGGKI